MLDVLNCVMCPSVWNVSSKLTYVRHFDAITTPRQRSAYPTRSVCSPTAPKARHGTQALTSTAANPNTARLRFLPKSLRMVRRPQKPRLTSKLLLHTHTHTHPESYVGWTRETNILSRCEPIVWRSWSDVPHVAANMTPSQLAPSELPAGPDLLSGGARPLFSSSRICAVRKVLRTIYRKMVLKFFSAGHAAVIKLQRCSDIRKPPMQGNSDLSAI